MEKHFITYADERFAEARDRIVAEAVKTHEFDVVKAFGRDDVSEELKSSSVFSERRGGGYWSWKPDIILKELGCMNDGDIIVYADSGCELVPGKEWNRYWKILETKELIAQKIYQIGECWTRRSIINEFSDNPNGWQKKCQFMATVVIAKKSPRSVAFFEEWYRCIIANPNLIRDVSALEIEGESPCFIENRHDQAVYSALIYKYLAMEGSSFIADLWEHTENQSIFGSQVIRSMRWNSSKPIPISRRLKEVAIRISKDLLRKPLYVMKETFAN
jgi:hypothetical protein